MYIKIQHNLHRQRGVASVEAILLIPFLLLLIALIISSSRYASHLIYNSIDARTSAWRAALFDHCPDAVEPRFGGAYLGSKCDTDSGYANRYLAIFPGGAEASLFNNLLRQAGIPQATTAKASSEFRAFMIQDSYVSILTAQHSLDAMPAWEREHMPNGYSRVIPSIE